MKSFKIIFGILTLLTVSLFWSCQKNAELPNNKTNPAAASSRDVPNPDFGDDYIIDEVDTDCGHFEIHIVCDFKDPRYLRAMVVAPFGSDPVHISFSGNGNPNPFASNVGFSPMHDGEVSGGGAIDLDNITVTIECEGSKPVSFTYKNPCK